MSSASVGDAFSPPPPARQHTSPRPSLVQQKLKAALLDAEKTTRELATAGTSSSLSSSSHSSSTERKARVIITSAEMKNDDENPRLGRAIVRYRQAATAVSFVDEASNFSYTPNFMPGVHFFTFLASKDTAKLPVSSQNDQQVNLDESQSEKSRPRSAGPSRPSSALSRQSALRMWVPDTVVYGETGRAIWVYSDPVTGCVQRSTEFSDKQVLERFTSLTSSDDSSNSAERVVIFKEPIAAAARTADRSGGRDGGTPNPAMSSQGSQLRLLNLAELKTLLSSLSSTTRKSFAIQRFVRCSGAKAFMLRSVYDAGKPAYAWMISNTVSMQDSSLSDPQSLEEPAPAAKVETAPSSRSRRSSVSVARPTGTTTPRSNQPTSGMDAPGPAVAATTTSTTTDTPMATPSTAVPLVNRICTSVQVDHACTFVKLNERACATTSELTLRIVKHVEQRLGVQLQTLVADFTKDADGRWWLLQIKAFQIRNRAHPGRPISLPVRLRLQYIGYRDSQLLDDGSDSDGEKNGVRTSGRGAAALIHAHRQTRKLVQCKCCMAAHPKSELSFKMTLKMINDMLLRIRARATPDAPMYSFLVPALARDLPDASLAYESWSVCSFCYAIYERDQQLQRVEAKFSAILGTPSAETNDRGLSRVHENRSFALDPSTSAAVLPAQLTLCRLILVINGIYDIPAELYDAETTEFPFGASSSPVNRNTPRSRLFLRITALGYTECVPIDAGDIVLSSQRAPRGATRRRTSSTISFGSDFNGDDAGDIEQNEDREDAERCEIDDRRNSNKPRSVSQKQSPAVAFETSAPSAPTSLASDLTRNYSLPLNLIRTMQFFAPRTPLQAKLKETSGITPFLTDANSIHIQLVRATDPPLEDPTTGQARRRPNNRRAALIAEVAAAAVDGTSSTAAVARVRGHSNAHRTPTAHTVVLGSTKIRMAQFQSAYVTKMDYYACMAFTGEILNVKGNVGLERLRYVDTKLLTSQFRLRAYNGVFIPDDSFTAADPLSSEWMDCLRLSFYTRKPDSGGEEDDLEQHARGRKGLRVGKSRPARPPIWKTRYKDGRRTGAECRANGGIPLTASASSLMTADDEEMDQELEQMIDRANQKQQQEHFRQQRGDPSTSTSFKAKQTDQSACELSQTDTGSIAAMRQQLLSSTLAMPSSFDASVAALMDKTLLSPRSALSSHLGADAVYASSTKGKPHATDEDHDSSQRLWTLVLHLNHAHHLTSREHAVCRWECSYMLLGQKRSAIERRSPSSPPGSPKAGASIDNGVQFSCTHKFFALGTRTMMQAFIKANVCVTLQLRNDMYASTRQRRQGEFIALVDLSRLLLAPSFDATIDIVPSSDAPPITPREAAAIASVGVPYLSLSVQLTDSVVDSEDAKARIEKDFVEIGTTVEGLAVLRKVA